MSERTDGLVSRKVGLGDIVQFVMLLTTMALVWHTFNHWWAAITEETAVRYLRLLALNLSLVFIVLSSLLPKYTPHPRWVHGICLSLAALLLGYHWWLY
jgi:hypothetical protein